MQTRPATTADLPAAYELVQRSDVHWFGAPEHDESEVAEFFSMVASLETDSVAVLDDDGRLLAVAMWTPTDTWFVNDPERRVDEVADALIERSLAWPTTKMQALDRDTRLRDRLVQRGFVHVSSMFDLVRPVSEDWTIASPGWPNDIEARAFSASDAAAVYRLIYVDAAWTDVEGHPPRSFADWQRIFVTQHTMGTVAWRGERPVAVAVGRIFSDGTGWIAQLAVAKDERGRGLGRSVLLAGLRQQQDRGARQLGLGVQATNRTALSLYLSAGLRIDREWMEFRPAP